MRAAVLLGREDDDGEHKPFVLVDGLLFRRDDVADVMLAACDGNGDAPEPVYYARRPLVTRW